MRTTTTMVMASAVVLGLLLITFGCSRDAAVQFDGALVSLEQTPSTHNVLSTLLSVKANEAVRVDVTATSDDHKVSLPRTAASSTVHQIPLVGLRAARDYDIHLELIDGSGRSVGEGDTAFTTGELPDFIPEMVQKVAEDGREPGYTLVEVTPSTRPGFENSDDPLAVPHVVALDSDGEVVWYYSSDGAVGDLRLTGSATLQSVDFPFGIRQTDLLGNTVAYWEVTPNINDTTDLTGLDPDQKSTAEREGIEPVDVEDPGVDLRSFHHEASPMPNGNILALSNTLHELTREQRQQLCPGDPEEFSVISDVVVELKPSGEVVRSWDLWDMIDVMVTPGEEMCSTTGQIATETQRDWGHANAVVYDPERDAVIVSTRHTSQIVAMAHGTDDGPQKSLLWTLGTNGTIPFTGDVPRYQHAVKLDGDGALILFDNGNGRAGTAVGTANPPYSRAVTYEVDDSAADPGQWKATQTWEYRTDETPGKPVFAAFLGDADRLANGNVLIDFGGIPAPNPEGDYNRCMIQEVHPTGGPTGAKVLWDLRLGSTERPVTCYRTDRVASLYAGPDWE